MKLLYLSPDLISSRDLRHLIILDLFLELTDLVPRADLHLGEVPSQVPTEVAHRRIQSTLLLLQLVGQADVQTGQSHLGGRVQNDQLFFTHEKFEDFVGQMGLKDPVGCPFDPEQ